MHPKLTIAALALLASTSLACPSSPPPDSGAKADNAEKAPDPATPPSPHANPHASPHANPHANLPANAPAAPQAKPPGPPRDVTPSGETREEIVDGLKLSVPTEWTLTPGSGSMRKAELTLPGPGGDATLVVYRFAGGAGTGQQNIDRWRGQIASADGSEAATNEQEVNGLKLISIDARGRFAGQSMPGAPPQPPIDDARLFAAMIEGSGDPYYFKLVGPAATLDVWADAWTKLLASVAQP